MIENKMPASTGTDLYITLVPREPAQGVQSGFGPTENQATTFVPDDSCAWSIDMQEEHTYDE